MPTTTVPVGTENPAQSIIAKIGELEAGGARIVSVNTVGDQHVILYENKPKVGRPPKTETRG